ncbi:YesU family protein [Butyrivibrio proteoclasticus]|nr:YesU family protein [Butyrivibrio proteoclasticus]
MSKLIYENPLDSEKCLKDFVLEGRAISLFPEES